MDKKKILHMLSLKSTWVILISQLGIILKESGVLDDIGISKYNVIATSVLTMASVIGLMSVYQTEPIKSDISENKENIDNL